MLLKQPAAGGESCAAGFYFREQSDRFSFCVSLEEKFKTAGSLIFGVEKKE